MKINKNQALYRGLPNSWITYSSTNGSDYKFACKVSAWNTKSVEGINEDMLKKNIKRRVHSFELNGGLIGDDLSDEKIDNMKFVEASMNEGIPDVVCKIDPTTFYCPECGMVKVLQNATTSPVCKKCGKKMNQLQMVYACECGYAEGVKPTGSGQMYYHAKDKKTQFKFYNYKNEKIEMYQKCKLCGKTLRPRNATDTKLFYSQTGNIVNLFNEKFKALLKKYNEDAELLILAKWFNIISNEEFISILDDDKTFFSKKMVNENDPLVKMLLSQGLTLDAIEQGLEKDDTVLNINKVKSELNKLIDMIKLENNFDIIAENLIEYDTLKYPKDIIKLDSAIGKCIEGGRVSTPDEIYDLMEKMHVKDMQISEYVDIVNYAYGYTRMYSDPVSCNKPNVLKIRGFDNKTYVSQLETEGILVQFDMLAIYQWLVDNGFVNDDIIMDTEQDAKRWFLENINDSAITYFGVSEDPMDKVTKVVYGVLHTMSHMFIKSAGKHSGLSKNSISEIIFPNQCSIFMYPTASAGLTLGSISGMFETQLDLFLHDALTDNEVCTFDPICSDTQNGACMACTYLGEVNCANFNKDLSRSYLYGGKILTQNYEINVNKGFWK